MSGGDGSLATLKDFRRYWRALLRGGGLQQRTCAEASVGAVISHATDKNRATGMVFLTVERVSVLALSVGKSAEVSTQREVALTFRVSMFRYRSQWWLLPLAFQNDRIEVLR